MLLSGENESSSTERLVQKRRHQWPAKCCTSDEQKQSTTLQAYHTVSRVWLNYPGTKSVSTLDTAVLYRQVQIRSIAISGEGARGSTFV